MLRYEVGDGCLRIAEDSVLENMLVGLGAKVQRVVAPFEPEAGAYANGHRHGEEPSQAGRIHRIRSKTSCERSMSIDNVRDLVRLLQLASPALPIGAFSYSQGLEAAVEAGIVHDRKSACDWINDLLTYTLAYHGSASFIALDRSLAGA